MSFIVDVNIACYNHENYIGQAIESVLNQKTDFEFRILVGDDASTDKSGQIIKEYENKYPSIIKAFYHEINKGINKSNESNGLFLLKHSKAKYIALLDGDDYWIDSTKLQKQIMFLENNNDYALSFHNVKVLYEGFPDRTHLFNTGKRKLHKKTFTIYDVMSDLALMHTSSMIFRSKAIKSIPDWFNKIRSADIALFHLIAEHGKIGALTDTMSVYRKNPGSFTEYSVGRLNTKAYIYLYDCLNKHFNHKYDKQFSKLIAQFYLKDCRIALKEENVSDAKASLKKALSKSKMYALQHYTLTLRLIFQLYTPSFYSQMKRLKSVK